MALAKFGMIVTDMRGSLGGHVFSRGRSGAIARTKVTPLNPQTTFQQSVRARLASISQTWRTLTEAQRNAWNASVANFERTNVFGDSVKPTGKNLFTAVNINLDNINSIPLTEPPLPVVVVAPEISALLMDIGTPDVQSFNVGVANASQDMVIFGTAPLSPGKNFVKSEFRQIGVISQLAGGATDIKAIYEAKFGVPIAGQKVFIKVVPINNGTGGPGVEEIISTIVIDTP